MTSEPQSRQVVLLVEDSQDDQELAREALEHAGGRYGLRVVEDGAEAVAYLNACVRGEHELPRLVLLDLNLPKLDGEQVLRRVRSEPRLRQLPIVVLSTSPQPDDRARTYAAGANGYVVKPVDFEAFIGTLADVCRYWLELNRPAPLPFRSRPH